MGWQVTATVVICPAGPQESSSKGFWLWKKKIEPLEATAKVYSDGRTECNWVARYGQPPDCPGVPCPAIAAYRDKIMAEEAEAAKQAADQTS